MDQLKLSSVESCYDNTEEGHLKYEEMLKRTCFRCTKEFSILKMLLNPLKPCYFCKNLVCEKCQVNFELEDVKWICVYCAKLKEIDEICGTWFYLKIMNFSKDMEGANQIRQDLIKNIKNEELNEESTLKRLKAIMEELMQHQKSEIDINGCITNITPPESEREVNIEKQKKNSSLSSELVNVKSQDFESILGSGSKLLSKNDCNYFKFII